MKEIIAFSSFPDFSGNCKALFEDMNTSDCKFDLVWFCKDEEVTQRLNQMGIKAYWDKAEDFMEVFNKAKIVINTHDYYMNIKNENQIFINLWHGLGPKRAGILLEDELEWNYIFSTKNDYLIATSEFGRYIFSTTFNIPLYRVKQFQQARYKWLFEKKGKDNLEKVLGKNIKKYSKVIMYAPTFKKGLGKQETHLNENNILNLENYNEQTLVDFLEQNNYLLILKLHPSEENNNNELLSDNIVLLQDDAMLEKFITINEVLDGVDLLISDYSSIYIDYINLERPILFFDTDKDEYEKNRGIIFNSVDFWWQAGPKVHSIDSFIDETKKLFKQENYYKKERQIFNKLVNGSTNSSNKELIEFILNVEKNKNDLNDIYKVSLLEKQVIQDKEEIEELKNHNEALHNEYDIINKELDSIKYSRSYKIMCKIKKVFKR